MLQRISPFLIAALILSQVPFGLGQEKKEKELAEILIDRVKAVPGQADKPFTLVVRLKAKADKTGEMLAAAKKSMPPSQAEKGCLLYEYQQDLEEPTVFILLEKWKDLAALDSHFKSAHFKELAGQLGGLVAEPPQIRLMAAVPLK